VSAVEEGPDSAAAESLTAPLPEAVRARVVALASDGLGALTAEEVPASLRPFRRFTGPRRARLAATPIAAALESDPVFRQRVARRVREALPELTAVLTDGGVPVAADPLDVAAAAYLLRPAGWTEQVARAVAEVDRAAEQSRTTEAAASAARLQEQLAAARAQARQDVDRLRAELRGAKDEISTLRHKLKAARDALRDSGAAAQAAEAALQEERAAAGVAVSTSEAEVRRLRQRLAEAESALETARRSAREGRAHDDARLRLLLDTVVEASQGLRRELALPPTEVRPADALAAVRPDDVGVDDVNVRALSADDPSVLDQLLALPQLHLVIDGYNVTKSGYGSLPLEAQRQRLVTGLGSLAARSGAEVTVCFDGAALDSRVAVTSPRGVRVLFSRPGETADELIRRLVRNEPAGRPVVVVSSDREVADGVRRCGARPVSSAGFLRLLSRS
jgi:predicted RNA-binding protein with PIN domain